VSGKAHHLCPNCHAASIAVRLSRYVNERCVGNFWSCEACGYEFETFVDFSEPAEGEFGLSHRISGISLSLELMGWCLEVGRKKESSK
jgi:predicted RNA-binding Zn-ribbon protein involved in translation (DUF1610 family)